MKDLNIIGQLLKFFDSTNEYLKVLKAGLRGYETFMSELKDPKTDEE